MGQLHTREPPTLRHHLSRTRIDTASLESEYKTYLRWQGGSGNGLRRATMVRLRLLFLVVFGLRARQLTCGPQAKFARDIHELLHLQHDADLESTVERLTEGDKVVTLELFRELVTRVAQCDEIPLSQSLLVDAAPVSIEKASAFVPLVPDAFVPPAQLFAREWSLVFSCLETEDCNNVNAVSGCVCMRVRVRVCVEVSYCG